MDSHLPLILVEGVLVFGGVLAFAWWQLRDVRREQAKARAARDAQARAEAAPGPAASGTPSPHDPSAPDPGLSSRPSEQ